ncbi:M20 family metallopeptidase [Corynebacterium epidermidicanis]|uniref:Carboxypeptidase G2 n=1 Tax=Corynebacterium epidermidicanis TaxID=1050174 RepID=A0A0G3GT36_9CORY|nr:M20 family metallopeptidase [Corynebacterium epidermidicanis]AKK03700.1 carboxypeptidase G2 [Corynebacterium epidermidicanis]
MDKLHAYFTDHLEEITADILSLVSVETYSRDRAGLDDGLTKIREILADRLAPGYQLEEHPQPELGSHLVVRVPGDQPGKVLLVGHYDTVWPRGTLSEWGEAVQQDGLKLTGPGIFDMKTGLVQAIWVIRGLQANNIAHPPITLVINGDEEIGSLTSRPIIEEEARTSTAAFVFEASHEGKVKTARKGVGLVTVTATGVESHAGLNPQDGASAITALMQWCLAATQLASEEAGTTINVGLIDGGTGSNVVAGKATAMLDIRIRTEAEMHRLDKEFDLITWSDPRVKMDVRKEWNRPPMEFTPASQQLYALVARTATEMGREIDHVSVGGASDANYIAPLGIPVVCGIGANGAGAHARHEFVYPAEIPFFTALVANSVAQL